MQDGETSALQEPVALTQGVHVVLIESALCKMVKPPPYKNLWRCPRSSRCVDRVSTVQDGETSALQEPVALGQGVHVVYRVSTVEDCESCALQEPVTLTQGFTLCG